MTHREARASLGSRKNRRANTKSVKSKSARFGKPSNAAQVRRKIKEAAARGQ